MNALHDQKRLLRFLFYTLSMVAGWFLLYDIWLSSFDNWLTVMIAEASGWMLAMLGFGAETRNSTIFIDGQQVVYVGPSCNGMVLMALFAGFIVAYPGLLLRKLLFIPAGILLINILNVLRVGILALNAHYSQQTMEFNHKYTFTVVVYGFIFLLWMLWVKKLSPLEKDAPFPTAA